LTLVVDEDVLRHARVRAVQQGTSVNALVRAYLTRIAGASEASQGMNEFFAAVEGTGAGSGGRTWTRDDLHDRF
jgi:plasmid stability protein